MTTETQAPEGAQVAAMRLALEALEIIAAQDRNEGFESGRTTASAITALRAALAAPAHHCTRSHPHEDMSAECQALTVKARADNAAAQCAAEGDGAAEPYDSRGPTTLEGWRSAALAGEKERDWLREQLTTALRHQGKDCWYWQNDGEDHLESLTNALPVVIRADHLRALLANVQPKVTDERAVCEILASIWLYGQWVAETANERELESLMRRLSL